MTKTEIANRIGELYAEDVNRRWADHERQGDEWKRTGRGDTKPSIGSPRQAALLDVLRRLQIPRTQINRGIDRAFELARTPGPWIEKSL